MNVLDSFKTLLVSLLAVFLVSYAQAESGITEESANEEPVSFAAIDPQALEILKAMTDRLSAASEFSYHSETEYDVLQHSGATVEFGASRNIMVQRPAKLLSTLHRRDGLRAKLLFDGESIWALNPDAQAYAQAPQPGDMDAALDFAIHELRIRSPLSALLQSDTYEHITEGLTGAVDLGESMLAGVPCDHLLFSNDYTDFQLWITTGDEPVLQRVVITYREEPGQPQFRAQFTKWDLSPVYAGDTFRFQPPEGAERVRFYIPEDDAALLREEDS